MPTTPPPTLDDSAVAAAVPTSGKERVLKTIGGVLSAGSGKDPSESPLVQAMNKHHQQQVTIAQKHYKDFQTYTGILATGVDPDTGKPLTADAAERYYTLRQLSGDALDKVAGSNKDIKEKLGRFRQIADHIVKLHPKAGGGQGTDQQPSSRTPPPPSAMDSLKQGADTERLRQSQAEEHDFSIWKRQQEALRDYKIAEKEAEAKAKAASPSTRAVMGPAISVRNARALAMQGKSFNDEDGNAIDLTAMPDTMGLKNVIHGGKSYYVPFSPNSKVVTAGNETYAVSPMDVEALSEGAGTDLGQHNVPRTSTRETIGVDANGNPVKQPLKTTSQPSAPGVKGRTTPPPQAGGPESTPKSKTSPPTQAPAAVAMTPGMYNTQTQRAIPVREAATQVFGDPSQPGLKSLKDYALLADNPESRKKLAKALNLTFDELDKKEKEAGSLMTMLERWGGVPQALAASKAALTSDAVKSLSAEERDAYDAIMSTYGAVVGLRSLTKASAAQFSVKRLEQELPLPGINSTSSKQYYDQLSRLAEQVYNGTRTLGDAVMPQSEKEFYKRQVGELLKLKQGGSSQSRTTPPPKSGPKSVDDEIMELVGAAKGKH